MSTTTIDADDLIAIITGAIAPSPEQLDAMALATGLPDSPFVPRQLYLPVGVNQFCRFTSWAWPRSWAALVR